jgi:hypothetical protein
MATVNVTFIKDTLVAGIVRKGPVGATPGDTLDVSAQFAAELVHQGKASYTAPPVASPAVTPGINILVSQVADSGATGRGLVKASNLAAVLTALGASLGANDSGGTGKKALVFPNATT